MINDNKEKEQEQSDDLIENKEDESKIPEDLDFKKLLGC